MQEHSTSRLGDYVKAPVTLRAIAKHAGVSYSLVAKVSRGSRKPNARIKRAVEELLGVPWRKVFAEEDEP